MDNLPTIINTLNLIIDIIKLLYVFDGSRYKDEYYVDLLASLGQITNQLKQIIKDRNNQNDKS